MKVILSLLFPFFVQAEYLVGYGTGSYLGRHQLQAERISEDKKHRVSGIFGFTQDEQIGDIKQLGITYVRGVDSLKYENFNWIPLMAGGFITYTDHKKYYINSPSKYDNPHYYDTTGLRLGLRFTSELILIRKSEKNIHLFLDGSLLERALIAYFNNVTEPQILNAFWSLGISVRLDY